MDLKTPVRDAGRIYKMYASRLEKLRIQKIEDFLFHIPSRYEDYSLMSKIGELQEGEITTVNVTVLEIKNEFTRGFKKLQKAKVSDETGVIDIIWFNQTFLTKIIKKNDQISLSGKITRFGNKLIMESPEYELSGDNTIHTGRLVPIYPETKGVSSKWLRRQIYKILEFEKKNMFEHLPSSIINKLGFMNFAEALEQIHFPKTLKNTEEARKRLAFDELFLLQLSALYRRKKWNKELLGNIFFIEKFKEKIEGFINKLPFELTDAQKKAVEDIFKDLSSKKPMNRLLQGDVGSGKTIVSAITMFLAHLNGFQSVLMAPTEILAQQHYQTINNLLSSFGVKVELITGSKKPRINNQEFRIEKEHNSKSVIHNPDQFDILIGTHAVLSEKINFENLGLVVIDEQQRFGVEQRAIIRKKGKNPHLLTMTATPIPRTIALTLYGDLDLSYLSEMPKGRKPVKTWLIPVEKRKSAYEWIKKEIKENKSQAFIICPFIEESENMQTVKAATKEFERLKKEVFLKQKMGLLHGKLKAKEKHEILSKFKNKEFHILIATPVVEVGIDIPNATIILIEGSERFGLAGLHQLRGRVGRGDKQSYCLLFTESKNPMTLKRLKALETMHSGAELAELDLKLRGPGEMYGTNQHGILTLKVASFSDFDLIEKAKNEAENIFKDLKLHPNLLKKLESINIKEVSRD